MQIEVTVYANGAGACTTEGPTHGAVASDVPANPGPVSLEIVFHEVLHTMDGALLSALRAHARE